jgi:molybdopterin converting factor small subunit
MASILFNAFSFLQKQLKDRNIPCTNVSVDLTETMTVTDVLAAMGISKNDIEGVFVNGRIAGLDTVLHDGDRVAAFPPGTPGPYRLLLGMVDTKGRHIEREGS